jgi:hypothetical protein
MQTKDILRALPVKQIQATCDVVDIGGSCSHSSQNNTDVTVAAAPHIKLALLASV